jgi:hypothetical protein
MPNRNIQAKHERGVRQRQARAFAEYSKSGYVTAKPFGPDTDKRERLPEPRKVEWFDRSSKRVAYVPSPCKRAQSVPAPLLAAWSDSNSEWRAMSHKGARVLRAQ